MNNNVTYKQLMLLPDDELTEGQKTFLTVHNEMVMAGRKAADCLIVMAQDLKRMRDEELYRAAGYETFKDYVEDALNIKERQAYNWINILDLNSEYLQSNANLGVTKLALIASASEPVQAQVMADETTADKSVRELTAELKRLEAENASKTEQLSLTETQLSDAQTAEENLRLRQGELETQLSDAQTAEAKAMERVAALEAELEEAKKAKVKTKTVEIEKVVDNPETVQALEAAQAELAKAHEDTAEATRRLQEVTANIQKAKDTEKALASFKVYFGMLNDNLNECLDSIATIRETDAELADKCLQKLAAIKQSIETELGGGE